MLKCQNAIIGNEYDATIGNGLKAPVGANLPSNHEFTEQRTRNAVVTRSPAQRVISPNEAIFHEELGRRALSGEGSLDSQTKSKFRQG